MWIACRIPIARKFVIIDEPPTETNGSGMPVIGAIPIVIALFTNTWKRNMNAIAARHDRAVEIARARDDLQRAPDDEQVEQQQDRGAEEPALLGERGEREVGRMLGEVVEPRLRRTERRRGRAGRRRRPR